MKSYFVTGASGAIGSALVPRLLANGHNEVHLLLRAPSKIAFGERTSALLRYWNVDRGDERAERLHFHHGDVVEGRMGLDLDAYSLIESRVTNIVHCAGAVRMNLPLREARLTAVGGAINVINLLRRISISRGAAKLEFVSTVGVAGRQNGAFLESWREGHSGFHNTYEQAKSEAEGIVRKAIGHERLSITVHRPSMVVGDSVTGRIHHFQVFYYLCEFLSGRPTMGFYPRLNAAQLDVIPVDTVADALLAASLDPNTCGKIFHICSGPRSELSLQSLKGLVRQTFARRARASQRDATFPAPVYAALCRSLARCLPQSTRKSLAALPTFLEYLSTNQRFGNEAFVDWFLSRGGTMPAPANYLPILLEVYLQERYPQAVFGNASEVAYA